MTRLVPAGLFALPVRYPRLMLVPLAVLMLLALVGLRDIVKDTRSDAFMAPDNPALVYQQLIEERFGLSDPLLIALVAEGGQGVYRPDVLAAVVQLTDAVGLLPNVDAERITSLATESLITGSEAGIDVAPVLDPLPATAAEVAAVRARLEDYPPLQGTLVAVGGEATVIVVQLLDEQLSEQTYRAILALLEQYPLPPGVVAHVAGEGAVSGYLGAYIDADARILNPIAGLIILGMIVFAFRRLAPALLALLIILASLSIALGSMAALGIPFYVITNALPVILIGISVADTIHICSHYFHLQAAAPQRPREELVQETMRAMALPVTVTSLTTAAGFLGLYFAADMPPFKYFGLFAALGVAAAWLYSMLALPALMVLARLQVHQHFIDQHRRGATERLGLFMRGAQRLTLHRPLLLTVLFALLVAWSSWIGSQLVVDDDRIRLFHSDEAIVKADQAISRYLSGTNTLDVVIETPEPEGLFEPAVLRRIEALQAYAETLPHVTGSHSIVDYLKQMNRVLNDNDPQAYTLPGSRELVAQYFLLYSLSADPLDFEQEVDYDYRSANVRLTMNRGGYQQIAPVVEALDEWIEREFTDDVDATISGRVSINYHWVRNIGESHIAGLLMALVLVWAVASLSFRSTVAGVYTLIPVVAAVLLVYAFMVLTGITLGVGTSMFAAVAIGLGVDFAVHTISRLRALHSEYAGEEEQVFAQFFATTGRALLLNVLAVASGFGVLIFSQISQLSDFGNIVMLSMGFSFLASVTLLPALIKLLRPAFIHAGAAGAAQRRSASLRTLAQVAAVLVLVFAWMAYPVNAADALPADEVVARVNAVPESEQVTRELLFRTTDRRGRSRERETISYRRYFGDDRKLVLFFTAPANIRDTAVLTWDYADTAREDDQWLYLPALRKVRRIPGSERGDYFLGTDFSYEDMKLDGKLSVDDYTYTRAEATEPGTVVLDAVPRSAEIAKELGYSRTRTTINPDNWMITKVEFQDVRGEPLKTLSVEGIREVDGFWTRHRLLMLNHQSGHSTEIVFSNIDYLSPVEERVFTQQALRRGP